MTNSNSNDGHSQSVYVKKVPCNKKRRGKFIGRLGKRRFTPRVASITPPSRPNSTSSSLNTTSTVTPPPPRQLNQQFNATTVHTLLQWEAKLPSQQEDVRELTMDDLLSGDTSDEDHVEFQTDDKICVTFYVPTGATVDSFCLLKNGTILEITILTHKLMWDPKAIHLTTKQSTAIPDHYHSIQMKARKRILSEAIKQNLMKGNKIEQKHSF